MNSTTLAKLAPCEASAAPMLANTAAHCPSKWRRLAVLVRPDLADDERASVGFDAGNVRIGRDRLPRFSELSIWILGMEGLRGGGLAGEKVVGG